MKEEVKAMLAAASGDSVPSRVDAAKARLRLRWLSSFSLGNSLTSKNGNAVR
jgi:hypothetical protein